jgi:hypothetical protein
MSAVPAQRRGWPVSGLVCLCKAKLTFARRAAPIALLLSRGPSTSRLVVVRITAAGDGLTDRARLLLQRVTTRTPGPMSIDAWGLANDGGTENVRKETCCWRIYTPLVDCHGSLWVTSWSRRDSSAKCDMALDGTTLDQISPSKGGYAA